MAKKAFLRIALPTPLRRLFDYLPPQDIDIAALIPGVRIAVPFQSRTLVGVLIEVVQESSVPSEKLKQALALLDSEPIFSPDIYKLCQWAADYYHYALGEVLSAALPALLRKNKPIKMKRKTIKLSSVSDVPPQLNEAQQQALSSIEAAKDSFKVFLLDGITGSGKTEVYLQSIARLIQSEGQALVLVPEISLTPQTIDRFRTRFNVPVVALHSGLSEQERLRGWLQAKSGEAKIVIGTRSAIFTPFANLRLIIVDEEHDNSFKQQDRFRYHARDLAIMRANMNGIPVVLGSATPSLESLLNVKRERYQYLSLPTRAGEATLPQYQIVNLQRTHVEEGLSSELIQAIREHLAQDNQVMLFLNRRGFAPVLYCPQCAWIAECRRCDTRMVYHRSPQRLQCHHCDARSAIPKACGQCADKNLQPVGLGTQRLEEILAAHFPEVPIIRVDRDTTRRKDAMQQLIEQIHATPKAILLGTQMLAKGHHFPRVTLVGIVDADSGLLSVDFRATEQMGQLLLQVAGRAGRADKQGTVVIQTRNPEHPLLQVLIKEGYQAFSQRLLIEREEAILPPYAHFAVFRAEAYNEKHANEFLQKIKEISADQSVTILGPVPALLAKKKGLHCHHLLVKANKRSTLQNLLKQMLQQIEKWGSTHSVKWILDVDPIEVV